MRSFLLLIQEAFKQGPTKQDSQSENLAEDLMHMLEHRSRCFLMPGREWRLMSRMINLKGRAKDSHGPGGTLTGASFYTKRRERNPQISWQNMVFKSTTLGFHSTG